MEKSKLKEKYGLLTAITMVVGIVIGSGVFFKAEKVLNATEGNLPLGILSWAIGGLVMVVSAYVFSIMASEYSYVNGVVDYAENIVGKKYAYALSWFMTVIYYPAMTSVVAWVGARYFCSIFGYNITGGECMTISALLLVISYTINSLSPIIAGKVQVSTTFIKMIPLYVMAILGVVFGLSNGMLKENFTTVVNEATISPFNALLVGVVGTVFAFEGWVIATSINAEIKNSKKNLPIALVVGTLIVAITYIVYYVGLAGVVENQVLMESGENGVKIAFSNLLGNAGGLVLLVFVVISCFGTLNGLMVACCRGAFSFAERGYGRFSKMLSNVDEDTNMPHNSSILGLLFAEFWLVYFYGANLQGTWFVPFTFDSSEIPIVTIYAMYIPIYLIFMKKHSNLGLFKSKIMPVLAILGSLFIVYACFYAHGKAMVYYLIVFVIVMIIGHIYGATKSNKATANATISNKMTISSASKTKRNLTKVKKK